LSAEYQLFTKDLVTKLKHGSTDPAHRCWTHFFLKRRHSSLAWCASELRRTSHLVQEMTMISRQPVSTRDRLLSYQQHHKTPRVVTMLQFSIS